MLSSHLPTVGASVQGESATGDFVGEWLESVSELGVTSIAVLGPASSGGRGTRHMYAVRPHTLAGPATKLCDSSAFGIDWRASNSPLVGWSNLTDLDEEERSAWGSSFVEIGLVGLVRVEIPLPLGRAFECFLFSPKAIDGRSHAADISYAVLSSWPSIKEDFASDLLGITAREREGLIAAAEGLSAQQAALRMGCTTRTVQFHWTNAMRKLSAENKVSAVLRASFLGLI
jgi:LuxR family quorum-sensing system transcriptional regulator SolR